MQRRRLQWSAGLAAVLAVSGCAPDRETGRPQGAEVPALLWTDCADVDGLQCAEAEVPLDYARPDGTSITLALTRKRAEQDDRLGTLVVHRGGPGYSARDYLAGIEAGAIPPAVNDDVAARYDILGIDTRGSGYSEPAVRCFDSEAEAAAFAEKVPSVPTSRAERTARAEADADYARRCHERSGELLDHLTSAAMARDLDLVREALGERRLDYLGQSYGTHLGAVYASMFPERTGRFVFDSVLDPQRRDAGEPGSTPPSRLGVDVATAQTLDEFLRLCEEAGTGCAFGGSDPRGALENLLSTLREEPVPLTAPDGEVVPLRYDYVVTWTGSWLYQPAFWNELGGAPFLAAVGEAIENPDGDAASALAEEIRANRQAGLMTAPYTAINPVYHAVTCAETQGPREADALARHAEEREALVPHFGALRAYQTSPCVVWQGERTRPDPVPGEIRTGEPVLIVNSRFDPATPIWAAERMHELFPDSALLVNEGWGHVASQQSGCVREATSRYLLEGELPGRGARCEPDAVPFGSG
ncbi:alpha/beta hydrolase [Saccharomonospora sp. NPDC006951]